MSGLNHIQDGMGGVGCGGVGQKGAPAGFPPVTSTNVGIRPQNVVNFSFNPFATLV